MTTIIVVVVVAAAIGGGIFFWLKQEKSKKRQKMKSFLDTAVETLTSDSEMLSKGDVGWRPLAKGESSIGLSTVVPTDGAGGFKMLEDEDPELASKLRRRDKLVEHVSQAARSTASKLEEPVREVVKNDKDKVSSDEATFGQFKHLLLRNEEVWMMVLQSLINGGEKRLDNKKATQYAKYWDARKDAYMKVVDKAAKEEHQKFQDLKEKLAELTEDSRKRLSHRQRRLEYDMN